MIDLVGRSDDTVYDMIGPVASMTVIVSFTLNTIELDFQVADRNPPVQ